MRIELDFHTCHDCPFKIHITEQGCCGDFCSKIYYGSIPNNGIRKDCPLKQGEVGATPYRGAYVVLRKED